MRALLLMLALGACATTDEPFEGAEDRDPTTNTLYSTARLYAGQGDVQRAEMTLRRLLKQQPDFAPAYADLARLYASRGQLDSAITLLALGLQQVPQDGVLLNDLGLCLLVQHEIERAAQAFTAAAGAAPTDARFRANLAVALGLLGRHDEALALYEQVLSNEDARWNAEVLANGRARLAP